MVTTTLVMLEKDDTSLLLSDPFQLTNSVNVLLNVSIPSRNLVP